jgi:hypothetical protein
LFNLFWFVSLFLFFCSRRVLFMQTSGGGTKFSDIAKPLAKPGLTAAQSFVLKSATKKVG